MCQISASFQDIDILNHGIQKRLSRVEASTSERRKRSYDVEEEVDESVTSGKSSALGKPDPKFLPTNLETLSSAEVQAIFNQSVVYNESKIDGLFTLDEILVFCAFSDTFLSIFGSRILSYNLDFWKQNLLHVRYSVPNSNVFCANSVPKKPKNVRNSVQIFCLFCAKFVTKKHK